MINYVALAKISRNDHEFQNQGCTQGEHTLNSLTLSLRDTKRRTRLQKRRKTEADVVRWAFIKVAPLGKEDRETPRAFCATYHVGSRE